ncbi:Uncharacterized protein APZ42_033280 [Daphnia magna]|uniref:Uncharacterized protein n=1 Tax=Daphnia magna TaxID=35525 RepID=A0A164LA21_9CRUS|nr:Uncharacterized protein APZ42_033280 [Daphnia magna]
MLSKTRIPVCFVFFTFSSPVHVSSVSSYPFLQMDPIPRKDREKFEQNNAKFIHPFSSARIV